MQIPNFLQKFQEYFVETPSPLAPSSYVQAVLLRRVHDFSIFRTEEDRGLNTITLPKNTKDPTLIERLVFLYTKQKAAERRHAEQIIRRIKPDAEVCYLKDNLCLGCPVCGLNGGIKAVKGVGEVSLRSRILYATAYSLGVFDASTDLLTFNAVDEKTTKTDQALGDREVILPTVTFPSVVTFQAPTWKELVFGLRYILETSRYGAETRGFGLVKNHLVGLIFASSELITPLDLTLRLNDEIDPLESREKDITVKEIKEKTDTTLKNILKEESLPYKYLSDNIELSIRNFDLNKEFIDLMYSDVKKMTEAIKK